MLSVILALSLSVPVFASPATGWNSFQSDITNNGTIDNGTPPIAAPAVTAVPLANNSAWIGVDAAPIIHDGTAYALHNSGSGANLAAVPLTGAAPYWDVTIDAAAESSDSQLSTPYITSVNNEDTIFAGTTHGVSLENYTSYTGWTPSSATIDANGVATFSSQGSSVSTDITLDNAVSTFAVQTNLTLGTAASASYSINLKQNGAVVQYIASGDIDPTYGSTYYTYNGAQIPAGTYTLQIIVSPKGGTVTGSTLYLGSYYWQLNVITDLTEEEPTVAVAEDSEDEPVAYEGQFNTPISYDADGNIYWGIWGGTKSYYQYNISSGELAQFIPGNDDFYNAGAALVTVDDEDYMVFGSEGIADNVVNGTLFVRPVDDFADGNGNAINLGDYMPKLNFAGSIRSSVVVSGDYFYFTSQGKTDDYTQGRIWRGTVSGLLTDALLNYEFVQGNGYLNSDGNTTSTPVVSENGYIYVGWYYYGTYTGAAPGGVIAIAPNGAVTNVFSGAPVQASPIVWTDNEVTGYDYIYFTTNNGAGAGYCYSFDGSTAEPVWTYANTSGNNYSLQGMASDDGYVIWGDDGNNLYIAP